MSPKFFPLDLSKFKRVSSDGETTTLRHDHGHEVRIAHNALSPKLRGNLAALPEHETKPTSSRSKQDKSQQYAGGGETAPTPTPAPEEPYKKKVQDFEKGANSSGWDPKSWGKNIKEGLGLSDGGTVSMTPNAMIKNPNHQEGDPSPEYMPKEVADDDKPLEQPYIDPVSIAATAATGGMSSVGPAVMNAVKNKATNAVTGAVARQFLSKPQATQVGNNSIYKTGSPVTSYNSDLVKSMPPQPKRYDEGGEVTSEMKDIDGSGGDKKSGPDLASLAPLLLALANGGEIRQSNPKLEESKKLPRYAEGTPEEPIQDPNDMTALAEQQQQLPQVDPNAQATSPPPPMAPQPQQMPAGVPGIAPNGQPQPPNMEGGLPSDINPAGIYGENTKAIEARQAAESGLGQANSKAAIKYGEQLAERQKNFNKDIDGKLDHINVLIAEQNDPKNALKANHYMESMDTPSRVATAIGLILGGMGAGITHQENPALKFLNAQIDRDINAQKANMDKRATVIGAYMNEYKDRMTAEQMARATQYALYANQVDKAGADAQTPIAKANALQASADLKSKIYPLVYQANVFHMANQGGGAGGQGRGGNPVDYTKGAIPTFNQGSPAAYVNGMVQDKEMKMKAMGEVERATNTRKMASTILDNFDRAAKENTIMRTGAGLLRTPASVLGLHQAMQPTFADLEGTVRQAAMDNTFHNITPMPGDMQHKINEKRQMLVDYLQSKKSAPFAEGNGIDLEKFSQTTSDPRAHFTPLQQKQYEWAVRNPDSPAARGFFKQTGLTK